MSEEWKRLGASSEMLALSSIGKTKNILVCLIDVIGSLNVEHVFDSARKSASKFPQLHSILRDVRTRGLHHLEWEPRDLKRLPVFFHDLSKTHSNSDSMESVLQTLNPRLDREWNLLEEVSSEFHCIKLAEKRFLVGWVIHHSAGDAALASDVGQETIVTYSATVQGITANLSIEYLSLSGSRKRSVARKKMKFLDYLEDFKQTVQNLFVKPTLPVGTGDKKDDRQFHAKRVFLEDESSEIQSRLQSKRLSLIDSLVAATHYAVDAWNLQHGVTPGFLTTSVSVNMRGRFTGLDRENSSSLIFFESLPKTRQDPKSFLKSIAISRIHHFRHQVDLKLAENIKMMVDALRIFPYGLRRKMVNFITNQHEFSTAVTLLGVIWPKGEDGKLKSDSAFTELGDLKVEEVIGIPYKMLSKTKTLLVVYIFRKRLNFVLSNSASLVTKEENEKLLDLIIEKLLAL